MARHITAASILFAIAICGARVADARASAKLLILSKAENTLAIVDPQSLAVIGRVPVGEGPHEVVASADAKLAFVSNYGNQTPGSTLSVIDLDAAKELRRVNLGALRRPHGLAECGGKIYITCETNCAVARYDPQADAIDWIVGTGQAGSHMLTVDPDGGRIYTTNLAADSVTVIDALGPASAGPGPKPIHIIVKKQPEGLALSPDGKELWVAPRQGGDLSVINTTNDTVEATVKFKGSAFRLHFTPDGKRVLATDLPNGELCVIDATKRTEEKRIQLAAAPIGITVSPDSKRAFVACQGAGKVFAIDLEKLAIIGNIDAGQAPDGLWWAEPREMRAPRRPGMLGVQIAPLNDEMREKFNLDVDESMQGIVLAAVGPGSPAEAAGLEAGDIITAINGTVVPDPQAFVQRANRGRAGDVLTFQILRGGKKQDVSVTLAPRPE